MPVSPYFNNFPSEEHINNEMLLFEDLVAESIQIMGHNVYYIPRESFDAGDMIFGEYSKSKFDKAYLIEAYILNVEGFGGQQDFFSKFGLEIRDTSNFVLSRRSFRKIIPTTLRQRPQEGDLVYVPVFHRMFEIKFIEEELMHFSLGKRNPYIYEMKCELFRYSEEEIATGIPEVDDVQVENAYTIKLNLTNTLGDFASGMIVYQSANNNWNGAYAHAKVKEYYEPNNTILLYDVVGTFRANTLIRSNTSGSLSTVVATDTTGDHSYYDMFDNDTFTDSANLIVDLTETNPFGVP